MAVTIESTRAIGHNPLSLSPLDLLKISHSSSTVHDCLTSRHAPLSIEQYARDKPLGTEYEDIIKPFNRDVSPSGNGDHSDLSLASSHNIIENTEDQRSNDKPTASDIEIVDAKHPPSSTCQDNNCNAPVTNSCDAADDWEAGSDQMEKDDGSVSVASSAPTTPTANTNVEETGPAEFDNPINPFESWYNERRKEDDGDIFLSPSRSSLLWKTNPITPTLAESKITAREVNAENAPNRSTDPIHHKSAKTLTDILDLCDSQDEPSVYAHSDPLIDSLTSRMEENLIVRDAAVKAPSILSVPKGLVMTKSLLPERHFKDQSEVRKHVKRKREQGVLDPPTPGPSQNELYGFRADDLSSSGAICLPHCQPSNLSNPIHPLLCRNRFDDTPDAVYDQMMPALRLVSMCLTQPACMQFWVTIAYGPRLHDEAMSKKYGSYCQRIHHNIRLTDETLTKTKEELENLGRANLIHFTFRDEKSMPRKNIWACTNWIREHQKEKSNLARSIVRLHVDYYTIAEKSSKLRYPETSQSLRYSFYFAVAILHELAHSIDRAYFRTRFQGEGVRELHTPWRIMEPFLGNEQRLPELGRWLERVMFGGEVQPINMRVDGSHGLCTADWPPCSVTSDTAQRLWWAVPMEYVQSLFLMKTWRERGHLRNYRTFHIPRTGARATYINSFTTMDWLESDEAAEALALTKAQPAFKKRLTATGEGKDQRFEEDEIISFFFGKTEATRMEEASRRFQRSPSSRRHSFHAVDAEEADQPPQKRLRRSHSFIAAVGESKWSQQERDAIADDLRRSFRALCDRLPAHDAPGRPVATSEIVKALGGRAFKTPRPRHSPIPPQSPTNLPRRGTARRLDIA